MLTVSLTDSDLAGDGSATARVINGNGLDTETVTLIESGTTPGDFSGTIATVFDAGASAVVNGVIGAQKDDVIHSRPGDLKLAIDVAVLKSLVATDTKLLEPMLAFHPTSSAASSSCAVACRWPHRWTIRSVSAPPLVVAAPSQPASTAPRTVPPNWE